MVPGSRKQCGRFFIPWLSFNWQQTNFLPLPLFPLPDSLQIQDYSATQRNCLLSDLNASALAHERAVQGGTHSNQKLSWKLWNKYCASIGLKTNFFLDRFGQEYCIRIMGAFAAAMWDRRFSSSIGTSLGLKTVQGAVDHVVVTFRKHNQSNPKLNTDGHISWILARQFWKYARDDPKFIQEKALPLCIIKLVVLKKATERQNCY